ncbi:MAG TPA: hypothetical protein VFE96_05825 [Candidatus Bathyarchaeia archaeon]|nr:hypothetical protein [Candidatus Bathyarchaeia archaeon]
MIGFAESFLSWSAATIIPAFVGLLLIVLAGNLVKARYLAAFTLGLFLWFFVDTIGGAASLDVVDAFSASTVQIATVGLFIVGVVVVFALDRNRNVFSPQAAVGKYGLAIPFLVAVSVGIHGLGEGAGFGALAAQTTSTNLLDAFAGPAGGGLNAVVAYVLHKGLEPMMIGACYCVYARDHAKTASGRLTDLLLLTFPFVITSLVGAVAGYYLAPNIVYFFALGTGTSIYAGLRIAGPLFDPTMPTGSKESVKIAILIVVGVLALYIASLFHSG